VGSKEKPLVFLSSLSSSDNDSYTSVIVPMKKSRGEKSRPTSGGGKSIGVSRVRKGAKVNKVETGAKGKNTLDDDSDNFSSSDDSTPKATIVKSRSDSVGKNSVKELMKKIEEQDKKFRSFELELSKSNLTSRMNMRKVQEELKWTGEETNFAEMVNHFCCHFLFPQYKFLKDGWKDILPNKKKSLYLLCMRHLMIPEGDDKRDIWERVIAPLIMRRYQNMKCNRNNDIK
jgi:hypothetical protein